MISGRTKAALNAKLQNTKEKRLYSGIHKESLIQRPVHRL